MSQSAISTRQRRLISGGCLVFAGLCLAGIVLLSRFAFTPMVSQVEVARAASPDGAIDAILIETNGGATTDFGYRIELVPSGQAAGGNQAASLYAARRSACSSGLNLRWNGPTQLLAEYELAEQAKASPAEVAGRTVAIELRPGITDSQAPCGGMEYNLRGRPYG